MKIGILTHYNVNNQGAQLQMYAMKHWLESHGHEVVILTYEKNFDFDQQEEKKNSGSFSNFGYYINNYLIEKGLGLTAFNTLKVLTHKKAFQKFTCLPYDTEDIDAVIIGSDEVFSIDVGCNQMMYGHGLQAPAIAYAPAFGRSTEELLKEYKVYDLIQKGLSEMYCVSARDTHTQEMIRNMTGRDVPLVCDPVLLYDGSAFRVPVKPINKKYMVVYAYDRNMIDPKEIKAIRIYAKKHNLITVSLGTYHSWCDRNVACNAEEWYSYFEDAECVVTDTFHGTVVAMKNHCKAAFLIRESINAFKMESLLEVTGLQQQRLKAITPKQLEKVLSQSIDYTEVDRRIASLAEESGRYLLVALDGVAERKIQDSEKKKQEFSGVKTIERPSSHACSGCGACVAVCPADAIRLQMNGTGFYETYIEKEQCLACGKCAKVCVKYRQDYKEDRKKEIRNLMSVPLYALQSTDPAVVKKCSSGGIAHTLSEYALQMGWTVVGAIYDTETNIVKHQAIREVDQLHLLDGSKYLQSNTEIFKSILKEATENRQIKYLVIGTPCQIEGLHAASSLAGIRGQFVLVDIFCHGVPSYKLWEAERSHINRKIRTDRYTDVQFRYKKNDWHSYCLKVTGQNGKEFYGNRENELFYQVFFENVLLGDACMNCQIRKTDVCCDLRLGDFWGTRYSNRTDGVSAVFAITESGLNLVQCLIAKGSVTVLDDKASAEEMLKAQNMDGYTQHNLHKDAMLILKETGDIYQAIASYRIRQSRKQRIKRRILIASTAIPDPIRAKMRKLYSSRSLK